MDQIEIHDHREHTTTRDYLLFGLVLAFVVIGSLVYQKLFAAPGITEWMRSLMGVFFLVFGLFKLADIEGFAESYANYDLIAARWRKYGYVYPFIELGLSAGFLFNLSPVAVNSATLTIMLLGSIGILKQLLSGGQIQCACLGTYIKLPLSTVSLTEDVSMAIMAALMLSYLS